MSEQPEPKSKPEPNRGDLRRSVVEVLDPVGDCAGSGFLLGDGLVVSCAHVVAPGRGDDPPPGSRIMLRFPHVDEDTHPAEAIPQWWRAVDRGDVAFLRLTGPPPEAAP